MELDRNSCSPRPRPQILASAETSSLTAQSLHREMVKVLTSGTVQTCSNSFRSCHAESCPFCFSLTKTGVTAAVLASSIHVNMTQNRARVLVQELLSPEPRQVTIIRLRKSAKKSIEIIYSVSLNMFFVCQRPCQTSPLVSAKGWRATAEWVT